MRTIYKESTSSSALSGLSGGAGAKSNPMGADMSLDKLFSIPKGAGITVTKGTGKEGKTITVERDLAATAEGTQDVVALTDKGKPLMSSTVAVRKLSNGDLEYDETIKWLGSPIPFDLMDQGKMRQTIKSGLPERLRSSTPVIDRSLRATMSAGIHAVMGPPYPVLFDLMANPEASTLRLKGAIVTGLHTELASAVPELSADERDSFVREVVKAMDIDNMSERSQKSAGIDTSGSSSPDQEIAAFSALLFEVAFPGKVVETNGLTEPVSGHVYWSLYPMSAAFGNVDLHLVVRP